MSVIYALLTSFVTNRIYDSAM